MPDRAGTGNLSPAVKAVCTKWRSSLPETALLDALNSRFSAVRAPKPTAPVDVFSLARLVDAEVRLTELPGDGVLSTIEGGGYLIEIDAKASAQRQRFTCAHELGHILFIEAQGLEAAKRRRVVHSAAHADEGDRQEERLCDFVAAELLMPAATFATDIEKSVRGASSVRLLASKYNVSMRAAARRVVEFGKPRQAIFLFQEAAQGWRLKWTEAPLGVISEDIVVPSTSTLAQMFRRGADFRGRFTFRLGPIADEYPVDAITFGRIDSRHLLMVVFLGRR
jgi:Zn-dependent peptidase ImmA (M78 family)